MGVALEVLCLIISIFWSFVVSAYRMIIPLPRKKIDGEIALITGGGGAIAECIALEMTQLNVKIVLWDINEEANERVAKKLREQGATVFTFHCDITDKDEVYRVAEEVKNQIGHVTILVNNAGVLYSRSLLKCSDIELKRTIEVNTTSHFWTTRAFLPHMLEINHGHIVTLASIAGIFGTPNLVGYCASKFGAVGFHESLRAELVSQGKFGIKTTCVCPFIVDTPLMSKTKISVRFPSILDILKPDHVAKELVDGMLRDKSYVYLPKSIFINVLMNRMFPEKALIAINQFLEIKLVDPNEIASKDEEGKARNEEKKSE